MDDNENVCKSNTSLLSPQQPSWLFVSLCISKTHANWNNIFNHKICNITHSHIFQLHMYSHATFNFCFSFKHIFARIFLFVFFGFSLIYLQSLHILIVRLSFLSNKVLIFVLYRKKKLTKKITINTQNRTSKSSTTKKKQKKQQKKNSAKSKHFYFYFFKNTKDKNQRIKLNIVIYAEWMMV